MRSREARETCGVPPRRCAGSCLPIPHLDQRGSAMNKTPTTLIIMDGFGLRRGGGRQRHPRRRHAPAGPVLPGVRPHGALRLRPGRGPAGRPDGQQRGGPHQHRRRPGGIPGPAPHHPGHLPTAPLTPESRLPPRHGRLPGKGHQSLHLMGPPLRRRRPLPHRAPVRPAAAGQGEGAGERVYPRLPGRAGRVPHLRRGLRGPDRGGLPGDRRRQDRHGDGPLLRHGPRQALGPGGGRLRRHGLRRGRR